MRLKKRIFLLLLLIVLVFNFAGCAKCINTEHEYVEVNIVDEYHRGMYVTPIRAGKVSTMVTHPAVYRITVEYNGVKYTITGSNTYYKYKDMVGQTTTGTLEIRTYDDGTVKYNIVSLE